MPNERVTRVLESIAANVKSLRSQRQMTQETLAEASGVDLRFLQKIEAARTGMSVDVLVRLADALHVGPGRLLRFRRLPEPRRGRPSKKTRRSTPRQHQQPRSPRPPRSNEVA
ncbi:MAG: helix-turn-helix transcriptional regulator [Deltaproteobacteria bacterium]|nr:helix-turn-helix transcriptional regulator [Deltaproteobacteria bacterium]